MALECAGQADQVATGRQRVVEHSRQLQHFEVVVGRHRAVDHSDRQFLFLYRSLDELQSRTFAQGMIGRLNKNPAYRTCVILSYKYLNGSSGSVIPGLHVKADFT